MPFDVDIVVRAADAVAAEPSLTAPGALALDWALAADPTPAWALANPERCLAFLFVSPRPCAALDALIAA